MLIDPWIHWSGWIVFSLATRYDLKREKVNNMEKKCKIGTEWFCRKQSKDLSDASKPGCELFQSSLNLITDEVEWSLE